VIVFFSKTGRKITEAEKYTLRDVNVVSTLRITFAGKSISVVSLIACAPIAAGWVTGTNVRCSLVAGGILMTYATSCIGSTLPWICIGICKYMALACRLKRKIILIFWLSTPLSLNTIHQTELSEIFSSLYGKQHRWKLDVIIG